MNSNNRTERIWPVGIIGAVCLLTLILGLPFSVFADEGVSTWRPTYDLVMRWVNFGILAFVIIKFAGPPLMNFLHGQKEEIQRELERVQQEKDDMVAQGQAALKALEESQERFEQIKARIIEQGQRRKGEIVAEAEEQSQLLFESASHKVDYLIHRAKEKFRVELLDMAVDTAIIQMPEEITPEDNQRMVDKYLAAASSHA